MSKEAKISRSAGWSAKAGMLAVLSLSLAGCGGDSLQDTLGYGKSAPDEFAIVTKAPLVIPPDYSLRPPQPGAPRPQEMEIQPSLGAQRALIGENALAEAGEGNSQGEQVLLEQTGATEADPRIRQVVNAETRSLVERDKTFVDSVIFWKEPGPAPDEKLVNPAEESQRIQQNEAEGKPVTEGETPTVEQKKEGLLEGIF
ncbi:DUF3035 domain-containing protein [Parvibaculum sp.]|uniref:DUF3035 domain-containing protein n=1 Tax=Parvibaculum sp. TaxID=2024848 RepID=UPI001B06C94A|nr:DUF3035 domain-containing protein [Parvibaculum sp.]MBO6635565.1 DUF3035 domain-containing protein [Parvibaculum sp.]MBO6677936.1 DUF3035 domain-containing protein [Parvibaculum sp.]MBO6683410.1 DUF3035 domain-containing protein [Parvibaculum sp.]MBO6904403.1 DUF3035 domain-containing protein [Parvibaculum sp.]